MVNGLDISPSDYSATILKFNSHFHTMNDANHFHFKWL